MLTDSLHMCRDVIGDAAWLSPHDHLLTELHMKRAGLSVSMQVNRSMRWISQYVFDQGGGGGVIGLERLLLAQVRPDV